MICQTKAGKFSAIIFTSTCLVCVSVVLSVPVNTFHSTSYTADNDGSHAVILSGDDTTGTHIKVASGPPMNSDSISTRFASPATNQSTYFIPPGQDQTIHVRTGNSNTDIISTRTGTSSGGGVISSRLGPSGGTSSGGGVISSGPSGGTSSGAGVISSRLGPSGGTYAGSSAYAGTHGAYAGAGAKAGTQSKPNNEYYDDEYDN